MELHIFPIFALFSVVFVASHAALSPEGYWNSELPNTAMPEAVKELLTAGKDSVQGYDSELVYAKARKNPAPFFYKYAATATQLHDGTSRGVFFLEKDLKPGRKMNLRFGQDSGGGTFLPRSDAEKIPFSSKKMPEILARYEVKRGSEEAQAMAETIKECEEPAIRGEQKYCATSLESMVDFGTSFLGKNLQILTTKVGKETQLQEYTITGVNKMKPNEAVVCHKRPYPNVVFLCHHFPTAKVYTVSMIGTDRTRLRGTDRTRLRGTDRTRLSAVVVCHTDTSAWNPKHLAFQVLKVQPGTLPVCHFLPEGHLVWVTK